MEISIRGNAKEIALLIAEIQEIPDARRARQENSESRAVTERIPRDAVNVAEGVPSSDKIACGGMRLRSKIEELKPGSTVRMWSDEDVEVIM